MKVEINSYIHNRLIFNEDANAIQWWKEESLQQIVLAHLNIYMPEDEVGPLLHIIYNNYSKWINDLYIRTKSLI